MGNTMSIDYTSLENGFIIDTPEKAIIATTPHRDIADGKLCGIDVHKRGDLLDPSEVVKLNAWAATNMRSGWLDLNNVDVLKTLMRLVEVDPTQSPSLIKLGEKHYRSESNATNRLLVAARLGNETKPGYVFDMLRGIWVVADALIIDALAMVASAQHRITAALIAKTINPSIVLPLVPLTLGLPPQFVDFIDRGKTRTPQDREYRDTESFSPELLAESMPELPTGNALPKLRNKLNGVKVTVLNNLYARMNGNNYHPSKPQQPSEGRRIKLESLFDPKVVQSVIVKVYVASMGQDGKPLPWSKVFNPSMVACGLLLRSIADQEASASLNDAIDRQEALYNVDYDALDEYLEALRDSSGEPAVGPFGPALADLIKLKAGLKAKGGGMPNDPEVFGCLVRAIGQFDKDGLTSTVWLAARDRKKAEKAKTWVTFGGPDVGPSN
jgi:hypothetical protein